jgi:isochorismate hydrolase
VALRLSHAHCPLHLGRRTWTHDRTAVEAAAQRLLRIEAEALLRSLDVRTVILTGIAGNNCMLFSANDAHMRDLKLVAPSDHH